MSPGGKRSSGGNGKQLRGFGEMATINLAAAPGRKVEAPHSQLDGQKGQSDLE